MYLVLSGLIEGDTAKHAAFLQSNNKLLFGVATSDLHRNGPMEGNVIPHAEDQTASACPI